MEDRKLVRKSRTWITIEFDARRSNDEDRPVPSRGRRGPKVSLDAATSQWGGQGKEPSRGKISNRRRRRTTGALVQGKLKTTGCRNDKALKGDYRRPEAGLLRMQGPKVLQLPAANSRIEGLIGHERSDPGLKVLVNPPACC